VWKFESSHAGKRSYLGLLRWGRFVIESGFGEDWERLFEIWNAVGAII
jgi:hypothetical protein